MTTDVLNRLKKHWQGKGAAFTRMHPPQALLAIHPAGTKGEAMRLEYHTKALSAAAKRDLAAHWRQDHALQPLASQLADWLNTTDLEKTAPEAPPRDTRAQAVVSGNSRKTKSTSGFAQAQQAKMEIRHSGEHDGKA